MAKIVSPGRPARGVVSPLGVESRFVAIFFTADKTGVTGFSFTPSLGDRVWLDHVWIWGHPRNAVDFYDQVFFEVYKLIKQPANKADILAGERVLPAYHQTAPSIWGLGYGVWSMDFNLGRWFDGPTLRFAMYGEGLFTDNINMHAAFRCIMSEV